MTRRAPILHLRFAALARSLPVLLLAPSLGQATPELTYHIAEQVVSLDAGALPSWRKEESKYHFAGSVIVQPPSTKTCRDSEDGADQRSWPPPLLSVEKHRDWNAPAIAHTLYQRIGRAFDRAPQRVTIRRDTDGQVSFSGAGLPGRTTELPAAAELTIAALEQGITDILVPFTTQEPTVVVLDSTLSAEGIREVVTVGESDFSGSPENRRHNISVGIRRFNGALIPRGAEFSFGAILGPVSAATGYREELVILGERTMPDFGGGLCQVSTTAYRGAWLAGFPITQRKNHSYAVSYYAPPGTDATVYPPRIDLRFVNDSPGSLLLQTLIQGNRAYFITYGTRDGRRADLFGPVIWDWSPPPPDRIEETTEIPPGTERKLGDAHPGLRAAWVRRVTSADGTETVEETLSIYEARPFYKQIGVAGTGNTLPPLDTPPMPDQATTSDTSPSRAARSDRDR